MAKFARDVATFWSETYSQSKRLFYFEALGTLTAMIGATIVTFGVPDPNFVIAFLCYLVSSFSVIYSSYIRKNSWMIVLMAYYVFTTTVGLIRAL